MLDPSNNALNSFLGYSTDFPATKATKKLFTHITQTHEVLSDPNHENYNACVENVNHIAKELIALMEDPNRKEHFESLLKADSKAKSSQITKCQILAEFSGLMTKIDSEEARLCHKLLADRGIYLQSKHSHLQQTDSFEFQLPMPGEIFFEILKKTTSAELENWKYVSKEIYELVKMTRAWLSINPNIIPLAMTINRAIKYFGKYLKDVKILNIKGVITEYTINKLIKKFPGLTCLCFSGLSIKSGSLRLLEEHPNLTSLIIFKGVVKKDDIIDVTKLTKLTDLKLISLYLSDEILKAIGNMKELKVLDLSNCSFGISTSSFDYIANNRNLEVLNLNRTAADGEFLNLLECHNLKELQIGECTNSFSWDAISALSKFPQLQVLNLATRTNYGVHEDTEMRKTGFDFSEIASLKFLKDLNLNCCWVWDREIECLKDMDSLIKLSLEDSHITSKGLEYFKNNEKLESLVFGGEDIAACLKVITSSFKNLHSLSLLSRVVKSPSGRFVNKDSFDSPSLSLLLELNFLEELVIRNCKITAQGLKILAKCRNLKSLSLEDCTGIKAGSWKCISQFKELRFLNLRRCPLNEEDKEALAACSQLKVVFWEANQEEEPIGISHYMSQVKKYLSSKLKK